MSRHFRFLRVVTEASNYPNRSCSVKFIYIYIVMLVVNGGEEVIRGIRFLCERGQSFALIAMDVFFSYVS